MNTYSPEHTHSAFTAGILALMERMEYRRVISAEDLEEVDQLRRKSYYTSGLVDREKFGSLVDEYDHDPACHVIGVYIDEKLVGTIRLHVVTSDHLQGPTEHYFRERAVEYTQNGRIYVDPSRLATDPESMWQYPVLPLLVLRTAAMASEYFGAEYCMSVVRNDLAKAYKKFFAAVEIEPFKEFDGVSGSLALLAAKVSDIRTHITTKLPFFQSTDFERRMLFAQRNKLQNEPLIVKPSAKYVLSGQLPTLAPSVPFQAIANQI